MTSTDVSPNRTHVSPSHLATETSSTPALLDTTEGTPRESEFVSRPILPAPFHLTSPAPTLIAQGAEALLYQTHFLDPSQPAALKVRPSKPYRHPTLDARLTKQRVLAEARVLVKLAGLGEDLTVPGVLALEWDIGRKVKGLPEERRLRTNAKSSESSTLATLADKGAWLLMEWIDGWSVRELLKMWDDWYKIAMNDEEKREQEKLVKVLLRRIGRAIGIMHAQGGVVHGDLTTSNIMVKPQKQAVQVNGGGDGISGVPIQDAHMASTENPTISASRPPSLEGELVLIDFGLAVQSIQDEDRAVDLYVLERAFGSTHPRQEGWFDAEVLQSREGYRGSFKGSQVVLKRLQEVRLRGRKRTMVG